MIKVVTIDFWDTLFSESGNGGLREEARMKAIYNVCLLYTSPSPRDRTRYRMPSSA